MSVQSKRMVYADRLSESFRTAKKLAEMTGSDVAIATWEMAEALLENARTVDAIPAIYCSKCRYWTKPRGKTIQGECHLLDRPTIAKWYCASAVPEESEVSEE